MKDENRQAFIAHLLALEEQGRNQVSEYTTMRHELHISDQVLGPLGGASVEEDVNESGSFNFEITIGPDNARRLVDFLQTLPREPTDDDDLGPCPDCGGRLTSGYRDTLGRYAECCDDHLTRCAHRHLLPAKDDTRGA